MLGDSVGCKVRDVGVGSLREVGFRVAIFRILIIGLDVGGNKEFIKYLINGFIRVGLRCWIGVLLGVFGVCLMNFLFENNNDDSLIGITSFIPRTDSKGDWSFFEVGFIIDSDSIALQLNSPGQIMNFIMYLAMSIITGKLIGIIDLEGGFDLEFKCESKTQQ